MSGWRSRKVIGKRIVKVNLNRRSTGRGLGDWTYDPEFVLDDGSEIRFVVVETEGAEYGIDPIYCPRKREGAQR